MCVCACVCTRVCACACKSESVCMQTKSVVSSSAELRQRPCCVTISLSATGASVVWGTGGGI